jgi:histidyl-tRNA synthetase
MEKPTLPKGTRDFSPATMAKRQFLFNTIRTVFQSFGFLPLETPAMENLSTLTGKYGEEGDQLLFRILNSGDFLKDVDEHKLLSRNAKGLASDIAEKGLRYDLTVPFARYVVMNRHEITLPFKRYQIQPVWRADRPQKGRYREFYQCDADVVGTDSLLCEAEIILMIQQVMIDLGISDYSIKINHRGILNAIAASINATGKEADVFVAIDKLDKIGEENVRLELTDKGFDKDQLDTLFRLIKLSGNNMGILKTLQKDLHTFPDGAKGITDLRQVFTMISQYGASQEHVELDVALARGLSYYTGCIFEVKINQVKIGSVSGGGRYDNLTQAFGSKERLSGVGISFGIDRIYDAMEELNLFPAQTQVSSQVLVCHFDEATMQYGLSVLASLRKAGIASELFPEVSKLKKQLDYANKKWIAYTLVIGDEEMKSSLLTLKDMRSGLQVKLDLPGIIGHIKT